MAMTQLGRRIKAGAGYGVRLHALGLGAQREEGDSGGDSKIMCVLEGMLSIKKSSGRSVSWRWKK
jgi:hypothetical protein